MTASGTAPCRQRAVTLAEVTRWASAEGIRPSEVRAICDDAFLVAVSRLLQAMYREHWGPDCTVERDGSGSSWLVLGRDADGVGALRVPIAAPGVLQRLDAVGPPRLAAAGTTRVLRSARGFLSALRRLCHGEEDTLVDRLVADFKNSLANLVLNRALFRLQPRESSSVEPAFEGHACHPFPALRIGPSLQQVVACSNLSPSPVSLPVYSVRPHRFVSTDRTDDEAFFRQWSGATDEPWCPGLIPLHPWQRELSSVVARSAALGEIEVSPHHVAAVPLASQRSCRVAATGYDVKLALDVTLTGERRLLYPMNVYNAPVVSSLVREVQRIDGLESIDFQWDIASVAHRDFGVGSHVAAIVRSPLPTRDGESVVPALLLWTNSASAPTLLRIADRESAHDVFRVYCRVLIGASVGYFARWGLAFEPHLQNTLIRVKDGTPVGIVLRDLDSTILDVQRVPRLLRRFRLRMPIEPWASMPAFSAGGQRLVHALLHSHIVHAVTYLVRRAGADHDELSRLLDSVWQEMLDSHTGAARDHVRGLLVQQGVVKHLLRTRLTRSLRLEFAR